MLAIDLSLVPAALGVSSQSLWLSMPIRRVNSAVYGVTFPDRLSQDSDAGRDGWSSCMDRYCWTRCWHLSSCDARLSSRMSRYRHESIYATGDHQTAVQPQERERKVVVLSMPSFSRRRASR
ncbi:uncharacterized protein BDZ99DRAFT_251655 [Mytilinidion resinicola]|uniref:Uncharacterized protein n=1 Tax=Mytilinidion resinicola TaxID=574789 RepID=A0A6A6YYY7_9PEZI|nr:uncharacterized protein BDZ99DRAFT_251655 [Mytilinidion resinicola]KAF2813214.1 hypothetical protein BDZ99DRAFT_251655 [Mytilinidion resinicola]